MLLRITEFCSQVNPESQPRTGVYTPTPATIEKNKRTLGFLCREKVKWSALEGAFQRDQFGVDAYWWEVGGVLGGASSSHSEKNKSQSRLEGLILPVGAGRSGEEMQAPPPSCSWGLSAPPSWAPSSPLCSCQGLECWWPAPPARLHWPDRVLARSGY